MSVLAQIKELEEQKRKLLAEAKKEALDTARKALAELNQLGFNYKLVQGDAPNVSGTRRSGIRNDVLDYIQKNNGVDRAHILTGMNVRGDKKGEQSVSNSLSALKKAGKITTDNGLYRTV